MDFDKFEAYFARAKAHLLTLGADNWADDNEVGIKVETIESAERLLRGVLARAASSGLAAKVSQFPSFVPCGDGSVDIDWDGDGWGILVNVEPGVNVGYYGDVKYPREQSKSDFEVEGEFPAVTDDVANRIHDDVGRLVDFVAQHHQERSGQNISGCQFL